MRRAIAILALALLMVGCDSSLPGGEPFDLVTSWEPGSAEAPGACRPGWSVAGELVVDPQGGTAIKVEGGDYLISKGGQKGDIIRVLWWPTFTGRRFGNEVSVVGPDGKVVARTGRSYRITGSYEPIGFVACGDQVTSQ
jgi:hypothetical protein